MPMNFLPPLAWSPGPTELIIILVVFVMLFGAKKLPELSRSIGKSISEFKRGKEEAERELDQGRADAKSDKEDAKKTD